MGISQKFYCNAKRPTGLMGKMMVKGMNGGAHERLAKWGHSHFKVEGDVLDIGCGGGGNIERMLLMSDVKTVTGADYSEVSVAESTKLNKVSIDHGHCSIVRADVRELPFEDSSFDTVTAFETVYFWPEIGESFKEVLRVMMPGGVFAITNESTGKDEASVKYSKIIDGMNLYTPEDLKGLLEGAGFSEVRTYADDRRPWICVTGRKP